MSEKPTIVIDTQILLRAVVNRNSLAAKLLYDLTDFYTLLVSDGTLAETQDVLQRPKLRDKFKYTDGQIEQLDTRLSRGVHVVVEQIPKVARDPKDDIFLATAVIGAAQYIVSEDQELLVLNPFENIQIIRLPDFMSLILPPTDSSETTSE